MLRVRGRHYQYAYPPFSAASLISIVSTGIALKLKMSNIAYAGQSTLLVLLVGTACERKSCGRCVIYGLVGTIEPPDRLIGLTRGTGSAGDVIIACLCLSILL